MYLNASVDKQFEQPYIFENVIPQPEQGNTTHPAQDQPRNSTQTANTDSSKHFLRIIEERNPTIEYDALNYTLHLAPVSSLFLRRLSFANLVAKQSRIDMKNHVLSFFSYSFYFIIVLIFLVLYYSFLSIMFILGGAFLDPALLASTSIR